MFRQFASPQTTSPGNLFCLPSSETRDPQTVAQQVAHAVQTQVDVKGGSLARGRRGHFAFVALRRLLSMPPSAAGDAASDQPHRTR